MRSLFYCVKHTLYITVVTPVSGTLCFSSIRSWQLGLVTSVIVNYCNMYTSFLDTPRHMSTVWRFNIVELFRISARWAFLTLALRWQVSVRVGIAACWSLCLLKRCGSNLWSCIEDSLLLPQKKCMLGQVKCGTISINIPLIQTHHLRVDRVAIWSKCFRNSNGYISRGYTK